MSELITFGGWLKHRRKELSITHDELAERIACSRITLLKIEAGERRPSRQVAELLAEQFNIPTDEREAFVTFARTGRAGRVLADGLEPNEVLAPWRAAYLRHTNLPAALTSIIGREEEEHILLELLQPQTKVRLLTLIGAPGIGKTRLALHVASDLVERYDDGVFLVKLATVTDPDLVVPTMARTLGVTEVGGQAIEELLFQHVRDKRMLLVLDNFEQILDAAPAVTELMEASPWLKVLTTSREALHVRGERRFSVQPLAVPDLRGSRDLQVLGANPAVKLFLERAQGVEPDFTFTQENAQDVALICARLEGIPLAIELAAARARLLSLEAMLSQLEHSLIVLTVGARDLPERQRTLRSTIEWSYDLLSDGEQKLLRRLGVFVGGHTVAAAEAVCNTEADLEINPLYGLKSLVDKSLLRKEQAGGEDRFVMLEMIREYALERLEASGESQVLQEWHARFFLRLVEEAEPELLGPQQIAWLNRLNLEHDNIRAVLHWALADNTGEASEIGLRLVGALRWFWTQRSHYMEGLQWAKAVLAIPGAQTRSAARAKALWSAGVLAWLQGEYEARPLLEESVAIWREVGDKRGLGHSLLILGFATLREGQPEVARSLEIESIELFRSAGDKSGQILALGGLWNITIALEDAAGANSDHGRYIDQRSLLEEAIELARETGDKWSLALALRNLGLMEMRQGEYTVARPLLHESLDLQWEVGTKHEVAATLGNLAQLTQYEGDLEAAGELYDRSLHVYTECNDRHGMVNSLTHISGIELRLGNIPRAAEVLTETLQIVKGLGSARHSIFTLEMIGWLMVAYSQPARAGLLMSAAQALRRVYSFARPTATQIEYNQYLGSARAGVDEATWQQAWAKGEAMSIEEALQFALESLEVSNT